MIEYRDRTITLRCHYCGKQYHPWKWDRETSNYCGFPCARRGSAPKRDKSYRWKGGNYIQGGYRFILGEDGVYIQEHRGVMEKRLGRPLARDEIVHHRDGDRLNNNPDNLELINRADHNRLHFLGRKVPWLRRADIKAEDIRRIYCSGGISIRQIARDFGASPGTVRGRIKEAREELKL